MSNTTLRDARDAAAFERDGYVVTPFLDAAQVALLRQVYFDNHREDEVRKRTIPSYSPGFYACTFNNDLGYRQSMSAAVVSACQSALDRTFVDYRVFFAGFLVKLPDAAGRLRVHQDPTLVDEARFTPVNVWCALQDIDAHNGALTVLPGSHLVFGGPRATSIPPPWKSHESAIESRMTPVHVKAGWAVLFTQGMLHASQPNLSHQPRIAATMFVSNQAASIQTAHRHLGTPEQIDLYAQGDDFMYRNAQFATNSQGRPEIGSYVHSLPYDSRLIPAEQIGRLGAAGV